MRLGYERSVPQAGVSEMIPTIGKDLQEKERKSPCNTQECVDERCDGRAGGERVCTQDGVRKGTVVSLLYEDVPLKEVVLANAR